MYLSAFFVMWFSLIGLDHQYTTAEVSILGRTTCHIILIYQKSNQHLNPTKVEIFPCFLIFVIFLISLIYFWGVFGSLNDIPECCFMVWRLAASLCISFRSVTYVRFCLFMSGCQWLWCMSVYLDLRNGIRYVFWCVWIRALPWIMSQGKLRCILSVRKPPFWVSYFNDGFKVSDWHYYADELRV